MSKSYIVFHDELETFVRNIFLAFGLEEDEANIVAHTLIEADLRGIYTHGVIRVGVYLERLRQGGTLAGQKCTVLSETSTTALLSGNNGIGAVISNEAVTLARKKAQESNIGAVCVKLSNHFGIGAFWAQKLAGDNMIGFACSNVEPLMPATGGKTPTIGNNPFSIAVPNGKGTHMCLDMACSVVAAAKMFEYQLRNEQMPLGWFLNKEGQPTTDPFSASMVLPFGGYKGYVLAVMVEAMTSLLSGGNFGYDIGSQYGDLKNPNHISHYFMAIKIDAFRELEDFKRSVDRYIEYLHNIPTVDNSSRVYYPGEIEEINRRKSLSKGIQLSANLVEELCQIAISVGLDEPACAFLKRMPVE